MFFFRYFESGYCKGFLNSAIDILKNYYPQVRNESILPWRIYTDKDIHLYKLHKEAATGKKHFLFFLQIINMRHAKKHLHIYIPFSDPTRQYNRKLGCDGHKNDSSIIQMLANIKQPIDNHHCIVFVHKNRPSTTNPYHRYVISILRFSEYSTMIAG